MKKGNRVDSIKKEKRKTGNRFKDSFTDKEIDEIAIDLLNFYRKKKDAFQIRTYTNTQGKVARSTLYDWISKKRTDLLYKNYLLVKDICVERLIEKGYANTKGTALTIFILKNFAADEFKDKQEQEITIVDVKKLAENLDKAIGV